jgi:hypothetical protein
LKHSGAQNSFSIYLDRGKGIHKNLFLAAQYYQRSAQQGHPDRANDFGFGLENGRSVEQNSEMASKYYKFASDCGHFEAKLNHSRCLRLLGQWEPPNRSSEIVSHPPSLEYLSDIFHDFLKDPNPLNDDSRRLLNSFERLKTPTTIPVISKSSTIEWHPDELGKGDSSVVKLCLDSKSVLTAVKTLWAQDYVDLIQREASILKRLKHPLILKLQRDISDTSDHNSSIVTEFAANGSLSSHLTSSECRLSGANRITKVVVGIALAMRYLHSQNVIHRDLNPDNILLDFDWNVRIADFGHSISPDNPKPPSLFKPNPTVK